MSSVLVTICTPLVFMWLVSETLYPRYSAYTMLAGDTSILDEWILNGLNETYNFLGILILSTVQAI